jgi:hypothetical protein
MSCAIQMYKIDISTEKHPNTFALVDEDDYAWASLYKWSAEEHEQTLYACRSQSNSTGGRYLVRLHRDVARARSFEQVDHVNGDGLDNRKENLRLCDNTQNQQNKIKRGTGKGETQYKGVFRRQNKSGNPGRYFAYIKVRGDRCSLGTYDTDIEAAKAYDSKALYYFGPFARLNFPAGETIATPIEGLL